MTIDAEKETAKSAPRTRIPPSACAPRPSKANAIHAGLRQTRLAEIAAARKALATNPLAEARAPVETMLAAWKGAAGEPPPPLTGRGIRERLSGCWKPSPARSRRSSQVSPIGDRPG